MSKPVLLVTGASRGIGAEIARQAATEGWAVCVNYAISKHEAENVLQQIKDAGGEAMLAQANIGNESEVELMFDQIDLQLGPVTGLVNNAGINGCGVRVDEMDVETVANVFRTNVLGAFICAKHAIRRMAKQYGGSGGSIVNISSAASKHGGPFTYVDYAASKGAIDTFTVGLAKEQADQGIRVNTLRPGATMTELSVEWAKENPQWLDWVMQQVPLSRPGEVREISNVALFLLSDKSSYVTGAALDACGGWVSP
ncbi:MAG: NAD(P)-dependent dehydrogenase (short-subunit alcohol dehydrogenase family) [Parasphingorhabdus sp.]|jgi:NAD(P)-dependent dehydrogenase (short-subunit alcohol dehydrogenase family)